MKKATIALAAVALSAGNALAGTIAPVAVEPYVAPPPPPVMSWTGGYIGGHVAYTDLRGDYDAFTPFNWDGFPVRGLTGSSFGAGLHAGYNHQMGDMVLGIEADWTYVGLDLVSADNDPGRDFGRSLDSVFTIAPRLGFVNGDFMLFGRAGLAMGQFGVTHDQRGTEISGNSTEFGWTAGVGVEYRVRNNLSLRAGVDYMDFGSFRVDMSSEFGSDIWVEQDARVMRATLGVSYYFN